MMGRPRRICGELTDIPFAMMLAPSEYLELRDAAERENESMSEYVRQAVAKRFETTRPGLRFGQRFRC